MALARLGLGNDVVQQIDRKHEERGSAPNKKIYRARCSANCARLRLILLKTPERVHSQLDDCSLLAGTLRSVGKMPIATIAKTSAMIGTLP
jgi:hypothetical protein